MGLVSATWADDVRYQNKNTHIHHLLIGFLENMWFLTHFLIDELLGDDGDVLMSESNASTSSLILWTGGWLVKYQ